MNDTPKSISVQVEAFYLVEIRLSAGENGLVCYSLYVNDDQPITVGGRPIVFANPDFAAFALRNSDFSDACDLPIPTEVSCTFDFAAALQSLDNDDASILVDSGVLNCLNALLDFSKLLSVPPPYHYTRAIGELADHLTFTSDIAKYFASRSVRRGTVAIMCRTCLGAILCEVVKY